MFARHNNKEDDDEEEENKNKKQKILGNVMCLCTTLTNKNVM